MFVGYQNELNMSTLNAKFAFNSFEFEFIWKEE